MTFVGLADLSMPLRLDVEGGKNVGREGDTACGAVGEWDEVFRNAIADTDGRSIFRNRCCRAGLEDPVDGASSGLVFPPLPFAPLMSRGVGALIPSTPPCVDDPLKLPKRVLDMKDAIASASFATILEATREMLGSLGSEDLDPPLAEPFRFDARRFVLERELDVANSDVGDGEVASSADDEKDDDNCCIDRDGAMALRGWLGRDDEDFAGLLSAAEACRMVTVGGGVTP